MENKKSENSFNNLPACIADYIKLIIKKMKWRKKVRADVQAELIAHFEDALKDCKTNEDKEKTAKELIDNFGDAEMIAILTRRAKKRCRPLWQKILIRTSQLAIILIIFLFLRILTLSIGSPTIRNNYVNLLNTHVQAGRDNSLNAKPFYDNAGQAILKMPQWLEDAITDWPSDFNQVQMTEFTEWLSKNDKAFELLRQGSEKPAYWNVYEPNDANVQELVQNLTKQLGKYRKIAQSGAWKIRYDTYKGNLDSATANVIALTKLGHYMQGHGTLIEQLVGISIEAIGIHVISESIYHADFSLENLAKMQAVLESFVDDPVINIGFEKIFIYDLVQRSFTDDGKGNGHILLKQNNMALPLTIKDWTGLLKYIFTGFPDRQDTVRQIDLFFENNQQRFNKTPVELAIEPNTDFKSSTPFLNPLNYSGDKLIILSWRIKTQRNGLIATLAVLRYYKQTGKYPDSLEELIRKNLIAKMPFDAYRNGPVTYKQIKNGFILYSFGENGKDDGGKIGVREKGKPYIWSDKGDAVFWPIETSFRQKKVH